MDCSSSRILHQEKRVAYYVRNNGRHSTLLSWEEEGLGVLPQDFRNGVCHDEFQVRGNEGKDNGALE